MTCKGICIKYKATPPYGMGSYAAGLKKCSMCDIFMKCDGFRCPCCNFALRVKPRKRKDRAKFLALKEGK